MSKFEISVIPVPLDRLPEITGLHLEAFQGYANAQLGKRYVAKFIQWFAAGRESIALIAVSPEDGSVMGYICGAPEGYQNRMNLALFPYAVFGGIGNLKLFLNPVAWKKAMLKIRMLFSRGGRGGKTVPAVMRLVSMAVSSAHRGKGTGRVLIEKFEEQALERGYSEVQLSVFKTNTVACRLYARQGYSEISGSVGDSLCYGKNIK